MFLYGPFPAFFVLYKQFYRIKTVALAGFELGSSQEKAIWPFDHDPKCLLSLPNVEM